MTEIDERQQKRAANIVWNCAGRYDFRPDFRAYDVKGRADLYWNCIFGAARKHYDYAVFAQIFAGLQQYEDADTYTDLFWLGLENCVYQRELPAPGAGSASAQIRRAVRATASGCGGFSILRFARARALFRACWGLNRA